MRDGVTVIYYTANVEEPAFMRRVLETLLENKGDLPLVTVSQEPMDVGKNICVGRVGNSTQNTYRQFQIGALHAQTKWVCTAEDDCLYPPDYFQYRPDTVDAIHCGLPMYALYARKKMWQAYIPKKYGSFGASFMDREQAVTMMDKVLQPHGMWGLVDEQELDKLYDHLTMAHFTLPNPIVSIKTDRALHRRTPIYPGICQEVPYWGTVEEVLGRYMG